MRGLKWAPISVCGLARCRSLTNCVPCTGPADRWPPDVHTHTHTRWRDGVPSAGSPRSCLLRRVRFFPFRVAVFIAAADALRYRGRHGRRWNANAEERHRVHNRPDLPADTVGANVFSHLIL